MNNLPILFTFRNNILWYIIYNTMDNLSEYKETGVGLDDNPTRGTRKNSHKSSVGGTRSLYVPRRRLELCEIILQDVRRVAAETDRKHNEMIRKLDKQSIEHAKKTIEHNQCMKTVEKMTKELNNFKQSQSVKNDQLDKVVYQLIALKVYIAMQDINSYMKLEKDQVNGSQYKLDGDQARALLFLKKLRNDNSHYFLTDKETTTQIWEKLKYFYDKLILIQQTHPGLLDSLDQGLYCPGIMNKMIEVLENHSDVQSTVITDNMRRQLDIWWDILPI